jgi:hypothetical protein
MVKIAKNVQDKFHWNGIVLTEIRRVDKDKEWSENSM